MDKKINIAIYVITFIFAILIFRLWDLQIIRGGEYRKIDERNRLRVIDILAPRGIIHDRNNKPLVKNVPSFDISVVREDLPKDPETLAALGKLIGISSEDIRSKLSVRSAMPFEPVKLKQDVSFKDVARVEARKIEFPGLQVDVVGGREYIYGHSASHVLGYLGRIGQKELSTPEYADVPRESFIGRFGVEKVYDGILRGTAGKKIVEVDATGRIIKIVRIQRPVKGDDIRLTIDINLQVEAEESLRGKAGAVVALKADSGEVLALASSPTFDPNQFVRGINYSDWNRLNRDPKKPLLNRAIQSQYPPGSTFKIISAIAALEEGIVNKNTEYYCGGYIYFGRVFRCWKAAGHGDVILHKAIVESCDVFFYEVGKKIDIDILAQYAMGFGLGRRTGIELEGEAAGIVPTSGWKLESKREKWYRGETLNTMIGQGYLSATPVQMAKLTAAVVNGGKLYKPYLLMEEGKSIRAESEVIITPRNIKLVKSALMGVVREKKGTGNQARSDIIDIGGKTGTTQVIGGAYDEKDIPDRFRDHAWFVSFAPEEDPRIAVSIFVEHGGHGSSAAAPIAKRIIEAYFGDHKG